MKSLKEYISTSLRNTTTISTSLNNTDLIDGHIHLFDHTGIIDSNLIKDYKCVCFADIVYKHLDKYNDSVIIKYYDNFVKNYYDESKHILLATGTNAEDIINIYKTYPTIIKGFGELKCYSEYSGKSLPYGNLKWIRPVLNFNTSLNLPVYIHFNLDTKQHREEFEDILKEYTNMPIVLCHCGMIDNYETNKNIYKFVKNLQSKFINLYLDISYTNERDFFIKNPNKLLSLNNVIFGTDLNPVISYSDKYNPTIYVKHAYNEFEYLSKILNKKETIF